MRLLTKKLVLLAALVCCFVCLLSGTALAINSSQFNVTGPANEVKIVQQAYEDSTWDWSWGRDETTPVTITDSHPPYWGEGITAVELTDEIAFVEYDEFHGVIGVSYYPSGQIFIKAGQSTPWLREVAIHEAAHTRVMFRWFDLTPAGVGIYETPALLAWEALTSVGSYNNWYYNPVEHHAEWFRITYYPPNLQATPTARTVLVAPPNGVEDVIAFHNTWCPKEGEPQPPASLPAWPDIPADDAELVAASIWAHGWGIFEGYEDGTFGPWNSMVRRHVCLVSGRLGYYPPEWMNDYTVATRGEVRDNIPNLKWEEERWEEPITRSQLLRLMYRSWEAGDGTDNR